MALAGNEKTVDQMKTICAISTAPGVGGIAVIRISGQNAIPLADKVFRGRHLLADTPANTIRYGEAVNGSEVLDNVLCSVFRAPHSFTGEDTVEIACHGSQYVQQAIVRALIDAGCALAEPGEFTKRAFLNGKLDLTEAEAVADLISAQSKAEKDLALAHLKGGVSVEMKSLRDQLLTLTSLLELELDFADHEELEFADRTELAELAERIRLKLTTLIDSFQLGNAVKNGVPVAIVGPVNAGKSTLLNALLGEEKAIVSDIPGTTRDAIEDCLYINGLQFRFIDTAGLRETSDTIENIGISRSKAAAEKAQIILYVCSLTDPSQVDEEAIQAWRSSGKTVLKIQNKADLVPGAQIAENGHDTLALSAKYDSLEPLKQAIYESAGLKASQFELSATISSARHYEALVRAREAILRVRQGMNDGLSGEFLSMDLHDCLDAIGEITGEITNDEVLGNIFSKFCIGK